MKQETTHFLGIDIGGTFTDFVLFAQNKIHLHKRLTSRPDPTQSLLEGLNALRFNPHGAIVHGTTIATNALLERKGAKTVLVTTKGFGDVIEIGRQNRPDLYALHPQKPLPLIPAELRIEVNERIDSEGNVLVSLTDGEISTLVEEIDRIFPDAIAVCLLFSFLNPIHEQRIKKALENISAVTLSSEILPEYREYERTSTTALNAYVSPIVARYLHTLTKSIGKRHLSIMQSNGGVISPKTASREAARTLLSGPAGGALGAFTVATSAGYTQTIGLDMGGTSTDVSLFPGEIIYTKESFVDGLPLRLPVIDIHTIGAGGGSIAWVDSGGALHVGPRSAGANPGPACYGNQTEFMTTTDANLILGRLHPNHFLSGEMTLSLDRAKMAAKNLMMQFSASSLEQLAFGVIKIANAAMQRAIQTVSIERGYDPRDFTLVPFGGAGPLHACALASEMRIPRILIPVMPGVLSALGMLLADFSRDYTRSVMLNEDMLNTNTLDTIFGLLETQALADMKIEGFIATQVRFERWLDMRYKGQSFEIAIASPHDEDWITAFHVSHEQRYGYRQPGGVVESVNARLRAIGPRPKPVLPQLAHGTTSSAHAVTGNTRTWFDDVFVEIPLVDRQHLLANNVVNGPAVIFQMDSTTLIEPGWQAIVDQWGNLILTK